MSSQVVLQMLANGMMLGLTYVLVALGLTLVFSIMHVVNFAHGELYMLGGFAIFFLSDKYGLNYFLALLLSMVIVGIIGLIMERTLFRPTRGAFFAAMVVSLGAAVALQGSALVAFGIQDRAPSSPFHGVLKLAGVSFSSERLSIVPFALVLVTALLLFVRWTKWGRAMRAVAQDPEGGALQGINVNHVSALALALGGALAGAAGGLVAPIFVVEASMGTPVLLKAFAVIVLGGMGSVSGTVVGGLIFGLIDSFGATLLGGPAASMAAFIIVIMVILFRPTGLMGHE